MSLDLPENWRSELPADMQTSGVLENIKSIETLAKMAIDARNIVSTSIRVPSDDASLEDRNLFNENLMEKVPSLIARPKPDEAWDNVWDKLGRPTEANNYDLGDIPDQIKDSMSALTQKAHALGLTQDQMKGMSEAITGDYQSGVDGVKVERDKHIGELQQEWGAAYDSRVTTLSHFAEQTGFGEEFVNAIKDGQMSTRNMKALETIVKGFQGEGVNIGNQAGDQTAVMTPQEAKQRISEMWADKNGPLLNNGHPDHNDAVKRNFELHKLAEAGKEASEVDKFRNSLMG